MPHQLSEFYRRGVVRPLDAAACDSLRQFGVFESIRCEWLPILYDSDFAAIWQSGLLQAIGEACGELIGDYEETLIEIDQVDLAVAAVQTFLKRGASATFAEALFALLRDAQKAGMPVMFVL